MKIALLKPTPIVRAQWKAFAFCTKVSPPTNAKLISFSTLKEWLSLPVTLVHYSADCMFWINLDASKEFEFGVILFYITNGYKLDNK